MRPFFGILVAAVILVGCIDYLGKAPALRLNADLYLEIFGNRTPRDRFHKDKECSRAHIRMRPERNDTGADPMVLDDRERWPVVRVGGCRQHQPERERKAEGNSSRDRLAFFH